VGCHRKDRRRAIPGPAARAALAIRGTVIGPGKYQKDGQEHFVLSIIDLDRARPRPRFVSLSFHGHGLSPHPSDPGRAVLFEKQGPGSCELDLRAGAVTRRIATTPDRWFYGHGAWTLDGKLLYATETILATGRGIIAVRDGDSFESLGELESHGLSPHDCVLVDGGRVLAITNGGGPAGGPAPSVSYVELASGKLLDKVEIQVPHLNAGHLALTPAGDLVVVSAQRMGLPDDADGGISIRPAGGAMTTMAEPRDIVAGLRGEVLSVSIHEPSGILGATNPLGEQVTFWSLRDQRFVAGYPLPQTRGIAQTLDQTRFLVSYGPRASLIEIDARTLRPIAGTNLDGAGLAGSHFIVHHLPA
jgi:hypothetical protein